MKENQEVTSLNIPGDEKKDNSQNGNHGDGWVSAGKTLRKPKAEENSPSPLSAEKAKGIENIRDGWDNTD